MKIKTLRIATRESQLALWQARWVQSALQTLYPTLTIELRPMTTRGDQITDRPLNQIGGKGLFLKELEIAMQDGHAELAVHSLKDVPMRLEPGFQLAAICARHSPLDALVGPYQSLAALPKGARVGSSSLRRKVQLRAHRPDLQVLDLRGNINTRLRKLDAGEFDAICLASAGLQRLELGHHIGCELTPEQMLPAVGQGALAIECLSPQSMPSAVGLNVSHADDVCKLLQPLACWQTTLCTRAERAFADALGGSCQVPIAAFAQLHEDQLRLRGLIGDASALHYLADELTGPAQAPEALGLALADALIQRGAKRFIAGVKPH